MSVEEKPKVKALIDSIIDLDRKELYEFAELIGQCAYRELVKNRRDYEKWNMSHERNCLIHNYAFHAGFDYPQGRTQDTLVSLVSGVSEELAKNNIYYKTESEKEREEFYNKMVIASDKSDTVNAIRKQIRELESRIKQMEEDAAALLR